MSPTGARKFRTSFEVQLSVSEMEFTHARYDVTKSIEERMRRLLAEHAYSGEILIEEIDYERVAASARARAEQLRIFREDWLLTLAQAISDDEQCCEGSTSHLIAEKIRNALESFPK